MVIYLPIRLRCPLKLMRNLSFQKSKLKEVLLESERLRILIQGLIENGERREAVLAVETERRIANAGPAVEAAVPAATRRQDHVRRLLVQDVLPAVQNRAVGLQSDNLTGLATALIR